jgi:dTDP-4-amino-4,6-dideoxygalactose transaminase
LDDMQAAILRTRLPLLEGWNQRRREIAALFNEALEGSAVDYPHGLAGEFVAHLYVIRTAQRDSLRAALADRGIATEVHYPVPDHLQESEQGHGPSPSLPETERAAREILTLPCYPELRDDELATIAQALRELVPGQRA